LSKKGLAKEIYIASFIAITDVVFNTALIGRAGSVLWFNTIKSSIK